MNTNDHDAPSHDSALANAVRDFCLDGHTPPTPDVRAAFPASETWARLAATGTALWLDTGDVDAIQSLWTREFTALTTNNTLLNREVQKGIYDELVPKAAKLCADAAPGMSSGLLVQEIAFILNAVHGLKLVSTFDADVSVELHTNLAHDIEASYRYGKRFHAICPDRFIVKIPLTPHGLVACRRLRADGVRVNFTLGFSARENYLIARVAQPNWLNVFMGRCNSFVADNGLGDGVNVGEKATLASQRMLREVNREHGTSVRQIGASMRSGQQAFDLMGLDVYTLPTAVASSYLEMNPAPTDVHDRTETDPEVTAAAGHSIEGDHIDRFWNVDDTLVQAVDAILDEDVTTLSGEDVHVFLKDWAVTDIFMDLEPPERERIATDGKIPRYEPFRSRMENSMVSWDGLLTFAGLTSFAADQRALDDRVRGLVQCSA